MWLQVKYGVITATLEERPSMADGSFDLTRWFQTFREVINPEVAERLLRQVVAPVGEWKSGDVPGVERSVIPPGLYRVEAEGEVIKQCRNEDYDEWKDADKFWSNYPFSTRQVIRIKTTNGIYHFKIPPCTEVQSLTIKKDLLNSPHA